jgi:hypothetical protein
MRGQQDLNIQTFLITMLFHPVLENLEEGSYTRDFERGMEEGCGNGTSLSEGTWREGSFTGDPKIYAK